MSEDDLRKRLQIADVLNAWDAGQNNLLKAENERLKTAIGRASAVAAEAIAEWEPEREYHRDRAERKGYSHDETAAKVYGQAIEALSAIVAALDQPEEAGPPASALVGLDLNITGGLPAAEYLRRMRAGTLDQPEEGQHA